MQDLFEKILINIGENPEREGLLRTPERAAESIAYLTKGYKESLDDIINSALFTSNMSEMVLVKNIELFSLCEHHLLPFFGRCHVGYIPNGRVIGLSKIARIVDHFARRLQIQEQLTQQIAETIYDKTDAIGVAVVIEAKHLCMMMRGVEKQNSQLKTSVMLGSMRDDPRTRAEFFSLIQCGE